MKAFQSFLDAFLPLAGKYCWEVVDGTLRGSLPGCPQVFCPITAVWSEGKMSRWIPVHRSQELGIALRVGLKTVGEAHALMEAADFPHGKFPELRAKLLEICQPKFGNLPRYGEKPLTPRKST